jgi:hypothetical protein
MLIHIYIYIHTYIHTYIYIYVYIYTHREIYMYILIHNSGMESWRDDSARTEPHADGEVPVTFVCALCVHVYYTLLRKQDYACMHA